MVWRDGGVNLLSPLPVPFFCGYKTRDVEGMLSLARNSEIAEPTVHLPGYRADGQKASTQRMIGKY